MRRAADPRNRTPHGWRLAHHSAARRSVFVARGRLPYAIAVQSELRRAAPAGLRVCAGAGYFAELDVVHSLDSRRVEYCDTHPYRGRNRLRSTDPAVAQGAGPA